MTRGPDLIRSSGDGFTVTARYAPTLAAPALCTVAVRDNGGAVVGAVTVPAVDGYSVWAHTTVYVPAYREAMGNA